MMMYRQCTTIGMNKKTIPVKETILIFLCFAIGMGIRIFLLFSGKMPVTDDMHFFEFSAIQEKSMAPVMTSGVAFAYSESLSNVFKFVGNRLTVVAWYHILLQVVSFFFLFFGCRLLFGKAAALFESAFFAVNPWLIKGIFAVTPENFYLFWWSFLFFLIGIFAQKTRVKGWYRKNTDEIYLVLMGFLIGMVCIWHIMGFLLLLFLGYALFMNMAFIIEKRNIWEKSSAMESLLKDEGNAEDDKNREMMPLPSEMIILAAGMLSGGYATLMKYTGVTGLYIQEQFLWWKDRLFRFDNGRFQDLELWLPLGLMIAICAGAVLEIILKAVSRKESEEKDIEKEMAPLPEDGKVEEKKEKKQVKYLDNPLPLPKKHVKRTLDFELDKKDDFDIEIKEDDDFDI